MISGAERAAVARHDPVWESVMAGFVQIIEFRTSRVEEIRALVDEMRSEHGTGSALRATTTADRDRPGYYLNIVEFESRESAMENSARPEIGQFAARMAALCDGPPRFYNLDVVETWEGESGGPSLKTVAAGAATAAVGVAAAAAVKSRSGSDSADQETPPVDHTEPTPVVVEETTVETSGPEVIATPVPADYPDVWVAPSNQHARGRG